MRSKTLKGLAVALAIVALTTATYATLSVYSSPGLAFKGQHYWNFVDSSVVKVRVQNTTASPTVIYVDVKARAEDGSTVGGRQYLGLRPNEGREVAINLSERITSLQFTQLRLIR